MTGIDELRQKAYQLLEGARLRLRLSLSTNRQFESHLVLLRPDGEITVPFVFESSAEKEALYTKVFSVAHAQGVTAIYFIADGCAPRGMSFETAIERYGSIQNMPSTLRENVLCVAVSSPTYHRELLQKYELGLDGFHFDSVKEDSHGYSRADDCWAQKGGRSAEPAISTSDGDIGLLIFLEALFPKPWIEQIPMGETGAFWMTLTNAGRLAVERLMTLNRYEQCFDFAAIKRCAGKRYAIQMFRRLQAGLVAQGTRKFLEKYSAELPGEIRMLIELLAYQNEAIAGVRDNEHLNSGRSGIGFQA